MPLLEISGLEAGYGDTDVLFGVGLEIHRGEMVAIVGSNGAGKTTLMRTVSGLLAPRRGSVRLDGEPIDGLPVHARVARGVAYVPEGRRLFPRVSVLTNLELGAFTPHAKPHREETLEKVFALFPTLRSRARQLAGTLSGGEQQMCAIGRGLMSRPRLLMVDEVSLGLAPVVVGKVYEALREVRRLGTTVVLVEQNVRQAMRAADRGYVLQNGRIALAGSSAELGADPEVRRLYLGM